MRNNRNLKLTVSILLLAFIMNFTFPLFEVKAKAQEGSSRQVEQMLKEVVSKYGEENVIFEDGIYAYLGEEINLSSLQNYEGVVWHSENEEIVTVSGNNLIGVSEGTTFIVGKKDTKYFIKEVYVATKRADVRALNSAVSNAKSQYVVYIDPGHGGSDPGASGNGIIEKNLNLDIGLKVKQKLESKGIKVVMSRTSDEFVSLGDISKGANYANPDIFISIHINSAGAVSASGIETYHNKDIDKSLAEKLQNKLISYTGAVNRGAKWEDFHVIRETRMPASLVECGFLTNVNEANNMKDWNYQEKLADAITDGAVDYLVENISLGGNGTLLASRIFGSNRYETSYEIFERGWNVSDYAVLASGIDYPDALCAAPLAAKYNAPIILVDNTTLNNQPRLLELLKSRGVTKTFIVGGTSVIPSSIESGLSASGISSTRLGGKDRYETSVKIAKEVGNESGEVSIVSGLDFADGLSISPIAAKRKSPILLTENNNLPDVVSNYITGLNLNKSFIIGSTGAISNNVASKLPNVERLGGKDRYETNKKIFDRFKNDINLSDVYIASGLDFPDALSASALAGKNGEFVILSNVNSPEPDVRNLISEIKPNIDNLYVLGSKIIISDNVLINLGINFIR